MPEEFQLKYLVETKEYNFNKQRERYAYVKDLLWHCLGAGIAESI
jgi:hypothetical protein